MSDDKAGIADQDRAALVYIITERIMFVNTYLKKKMLFAGEQIFIPFVTHGARKPAVMTSRGPCGVMLLFP